MQEYTPRNQVCKIHVYLGGLPSSTNFHDESQTLFVANTPISNKSMEPLCFFIIQFIDYTVKPHYSGHSISRLPLYKSHICVNQ